ncbi:hypothetical protein Dimus_015968 [Dionaea muscipula]
MWVPFCITLLLRFIFTIEASAQIFLSLNEVFWVFGFCCRILDWSFGVFILFSVSIPLSLSPFFPLSYFVSSVSFVWALIRDAFFIVRQQVSLAVAEFDSLWLLNGSA